MSTTARLHLPYIAPQQAQKQVTYNEAMAQLDQLVQPAVLSRSTSTPPASPAEGESYIVGAGGTDAWSGKDGRFAAFRDGGWHFLSPTSGAQAYVADTGELALFAGGGWVATSESGSWTPELSFGGADTGIAYDAGQTAGRYMRTGRLVVATARLVLTSKGSASGAAVVGGLPFAADAVVPVACTVGPASGLDSVSGGLVALLGAGGTTMALLAANGGAASPLDAANFSDAAVLHLQAAYGTA